MGREGIHPGIIFGALAAVLALGAYLYVSMVRDRTPPPPAELTTPAPDLDGMGDGAEATPPPPPPLELPPLDASDALIRDLVARLSARPELASWLVDEDLARSFVATVDQLARGESPSAHLGALKPEQPFEASARDDRLRIDPRSHRRYDLATEVFTSLDTEGVAALYRDLEPLLEEAYRELGYPEGGFEARLAEAIARLRATPIVEDPELVPTVRGFRFADPELEALSPAQKHLLRMGPENARRVQEKLRALAAAAGLSNG